MAEPGIAGQVGAGTTQEAGSRTMSKVRALSPPNRENRRLGAMEAGKWYLYN
jgi:hypothetical protein